MAVCHIVLFVYSCHRIVERTERGSRKGNGGANAVWDWNGTMHR